MRSISSRSPVNTNTWPMLLQTCLLVGVTLLTQATAAAERRVALLIGNASYQHEKKLSNPVNDAELLGGVLKDTLKFDDVRIERNLSVHAMDKVVEDFAQRAKGADSVVFYYSGHGIKSPDRRSFLLPVDARTGTGDAPALDRQAVSAEAIRDKLKAAGARVTLLILDACRDGPGGGKSGSKGLARIGGGNGLLVAYATEEDQVAQDGKGRNSPYAEALAQALKRTDLPILEQLDWVADEVHRKEPSQQPTRDGNLRAKAYLVNPSLGQGAVAATQVASIKPEPVTHAARPSSEPATTPPTPVSTGSTLLPVPSTAIPWKNAKLEVATEASRITMAEWRKAANSSTCAPLGLASNTGHAGKPRRANFSGGWAVAFDLAGHRSAYGIAGAGTRASTDTEIQSWPYFRFYADGSAVGYGLSGGESYPSSNPDGRGQESLAYLRISGQFCLYNIWSKLGRQHLELLISELRMLKMR